MKLRPRKRTVIAGVAVVAAAAATVAGFQVAQAAETEQAHYYIEVGGTGAAADHPKCTDSYDAANTGLKGGKEVPVCYAASLAPVMGSYPGELPAPPGAPNYDDSVKQGVENTIKAIHDTQKNDPGAQMTIVGYSQGADVADRVLEQVAKGEVDVPKELFSGKLYSDPRQPETGVFAKIPGGVSAGGITSPGAGPADFSGIPVERHCIEEDGICDATKLESIGGYFAHHQNYHKPGDIMEKTIGEPVKNETTWYPKP